MEPKHHADLQAGSSTASCTGQPEICTARQPTQLLQLELTASSSKDPAYLLCRHAPSCFDWMCPSMRTPIATKSDIRCWHAGALQDTWHQVRGLAWQVLDDLPTPLPGLGKPEDLEPLLAAAKQLLGSPRVPECDAGAPCACSCALPVNDAESGLVGGMRLCWPQLSRGGIM